MNIGIAKFIIEVQNYVQYCLFCFICFRIFIILVTVYLTPLNKALIELELSLYKRMLTMLSLLIYKQIIFCYKYQT